LKLPHRLIFLFTFVLSFSFLASAQDSGQSLGDIARKERARRMAETDVNEVAGMKEAEFHANILFTDSQSEIEKWVLMPAAEKPNAGRMRQVTRDKAIRVPFVVTDYPYPTSEKMDLTTHVRFISPTGKVLLDAPHFSEDIGSDPKSPHTIVLNPVMNMTFDSGDVSGVYTFRLTIVDHIHGTYAKAEEKLELIAGKTESSGNAGGATVVPTSGTR
jgi:hypothetical protein